MVELRKTDFVGEVPVMDRIGERVISTARVERTKSGHLVFHTDLQAIPEAMIEGFSLGSFSIAEDDNGPIPLEK